MGCEGEPVVIIWCSRGGVTSEMISDPGVRLLRFRGAKVKTFSGSGSDGSDVGSDGVKPGWPATPTPKTDIRKIKKGSF